jgi:hypothetical protein
MNQGAHRNILKIGIMKLAPHAIAQSMLNPVLPAIQKSWTAIVWKFGKNNGCPWVNLPSLAVFDYLV